MKWLQFATVALLASCACRGAFIWISRRDDPRVVDAYLEAGVPPNQRLEDQGRCRVVCPAFDGGAVQCEYFPQCLQADRSLRGCDGGGADGEMVSSVFVNCQILSDQCSFH